MKRAASFILAVLMFLTLAACVVVIDRTEQESSVPSPTGKSDKTPESTPGETGTEPVSTPDESNEGPEITPGGDKADGYRLPVGAASVYELYGTVVDFLNHGFHYDDLRNVYAPILTLAFFSKWTEKPEDNFTLGMNYDEACALIASLVDKASTIEPPVRGGILDRYLIDYDAFQSLFPESMQAQINENYEGFKNFIKDFAYYSYVPGSGDRDGENPFHTSQTVWEKLNQGELEIEAFHSNDLDEDLYLNFPQAYEIDLGRYADGYDVYRMGMYYVQIGVRYYFVGFQLTV